MPTVKDIIVTKPTPQQQAQCQSWPIWKKNACTFEWEYSEKETCLLIEGQVTVTDGNGSVSFAAGDLVIFPKDLQCTWHITKSVSKHYNFG